MLFGEAIFNCDILALDKADIGEPVAKCGGQFLGRARSITRKKSHYRHRLLLRHATALPKSVMNSRRLITGPPRVRTSHRNGKIEWLGGVLHVRFGLIADIVAASKLFASAWSREKSSNSPVIVRT